MNGIYTLYYDRVNYAVTYMTFESLDKIPKWIRPKLEREIADGGRGRGRGRGGGKERG